jgi:tRNA-splicing ligase RtcB (3'-phosphate/5'-hydroxy nucleic acid ligase)
MSGQVWNGPIEKIDDYRYRIPISYKSGMRVPGLIFASPELIEQIKKDQAPEQVANVASLPGIVGHSMAMPDIHWGYGFCIGGVAATDPEREGVISPGGVGYDINCGVRLLRTNLSAGEIRSSLEKLIRMLFNKVPAGVGKGGKYVFGKGEARHLLAGGVKWVVGQGLGTEGDIECCEAQGAIEGADPQALSDRAYQRGEDQCGTLGSGNHFLEVQEVAEIFDPAAAGVFGLTLGQVTVMIHSGSRGLGYQVCEDAIHDLRNIPAKFGIALPDHQLVCAPVHSPEGKKYLGAMRAAANFAWANRQILTHLTREIFSDFFGRPLESLGLELIYDVAHNIAKMEEHEVEGVLKLLCVHRKGATRAFPPGHPELPERYRGTGQPVIIPGDMGRASYLLVGEPRAMAETFGSTCHGAGRMLSRTAAVKAAKGRSIFAELAQEGIVAISRDRQGLAEEQPAAYKNVTEVVDAVVGAGLARKVARMKPMGVIKG